MCAKRIDVTTANDLTCGPTHEEGDAVTTIILRSFLAAHASGKTKFLFSLFIVNDALGGAIIGSKDYDGVFVELVCLEVFFEFGKVIVNIGHHAIEGWFGNIGIVFIGLFILIWTVEWCVWCIG